MTIDECKANLRMISILMDDNEQAEVIELTCKNACRGLEELKLLRQENGCDKCEGMQWDALYHSEIEGYNKALDDFVNAYYKYCETQYGRLADDEMVDMAKVKEKLRK